MTAALALVGLAANTGQSAGEDVRELLQLWNVLKGEMSLVGPRPFDVEEFNRLQSENCRWVKERHAVRPGITGLWQIGGRHALPFQKLMELDLSYVRQQGLRLDLVILSRTAKAILKNRATASLPDVRI